MLNRDSSVPIYIQIQEQLEEMLQSGVLKPNDLVPSENEMAEKLKVSRLTVRKSYGEMVKRGLFFTIQGKGTYVKAVSPPEKEGGINAYSSSTKVIGVILPEVHEFYREIFQEIQNCCAKVGASVLLMFNDEIQSEITAIKQMLESRVDGILIGPSRHAGTVVEHYQKLISSGIPTVMIGRPPFKVSAAAVFCDDVLGVYRAVEYLIAHENTRICYVTSNTYEDEAAKERYSGYFAAMRDYLPDEEKIVLDLDSDQYEVQLRKLVTGPDPVSAFFCYCDVAAARVYDSLESLGKRIPEDIEIIGYDNVNDPKNFGKDKRITSVDQRRKLMASQAVALLSELMERKESKHMHKEIVVHPKLVIKETTREEV